MNWQIEHIILYIIVPTLFVGIILYGLLSGEESTRTEKKYKVRFKLRNGSFKADNIRRGASVIGSAGSGKTESVVYNFLQHFSKHGFCGVIHDYKDFELTEIAYPLFKERNIKFYTIAFDVIHYRVNPIAPMYLPNEESVNEVAGAFINGIESEKQTAGIKSTLANAFKKISSQKLFYVLSKDEVPLDINNPEHPSVVSLVNHPKYDSAYSPVIAMVMHTIIKQMSVRGRDHSFLLMEEAPTLKLPNMHRIPATLRSYDICTVYVMQDKIQNDLLYGDKASKAILSNLSYQFFGKVNDPDTAKYYELFFEIIKKPTHSVSKSSGLSFESRITKGEKEVSKRRADLFFRLRQGEFIAFADGKDRKVWFKRPVIHKALPSPIDVSPSDLEANYRKIHSEALSMFK